MKKKGLLISTIVMVVVLIAALTTSTYAWFQTSSVTSIDGFSVSIRTDNAVNIGIKKDYSSTISTSGSSSANNVTDSMFATGTVAFTTTTANVGTLNPGSWIGTDGLSSSLSHNISWNSQTKAVGVTTATVSDENYNDVSYSNTKYLTSWSSNSNTSYTLTSGTVIAANGTNGSNGTLSNISKAYANINGTGDGDYVHFILGASPTRNLQRNNLVVLLYPENSTNLGVLASIHVAYRVTKNSDKSLGAWKEVDLYGDNHSATKVTSNTITALSQQLQDTYNATYGSDTTTKNVPTGAVALVIEGLDTEKDAISQVELVIYMAGADSDCSDTGMTSSGRIELFFDTANAMTATRSTDGSITVNCNEKYYNGTNNKIYISEDGTLDSGKATLVTGSWGSDDGVFTSSTKHPNTSLATYKYILVTNNPNEGTANIIAKIEL